MSHDTDTLSATIPEETEPQASPLVLEPSEYAEYLLHARSDILFILKGLREKIAQITVFFNEGEDLVLTSLLAIQEDRLIFDYGASEASNQKIQKADRLFCVTSQEKVKIQFVLHGFRKITFEGRPAFEAAFPENLLRLQRREYFRLTMPVTRPLTCNIPVDDGNGGAKMVSFSGVDISGGGIALAFSPECPRLEVNTDYPGCVIDLPEVGRVVTTIRVRSRFDITLRNGANLQRAGCQFVNIPGPMANLIQRYILKIERERKARESGLA